PKFKGGVITMKFVLQTQRMKQFYRRDFVYLSQMLYAIEMYRGIRGVAMAKLEHVEQAIAKKLDAVRKLFVQASKEAAALINANGHGDTQIAYPTPVQYRTPIISPFAREYMEILKLADDAFARLHTCHLLGLVDTKRKFGTEANYRKAVRAISEVVRLSRIEL